MSFPSVWVGLLFADVLDAFFDLVAVRDFLELLSLVLLAEGLRLWRCDLDRELGLDGLSGLVFGHDGLGGTGLGEHLRFRLGEVHLLPYLALEVELVELRTDRLASGSRVGDDAVVRVHAFVVAASHAHSRFEVPLCVYQGL